MSGGSGHLVVGLLVGLAVHVVLRRGGRRARSVIGVRPAAWRPGVTWRRLRARRAQHAPELVRLVVAQVGALLRAGASPAVAWQRAAEVRADPRGIPDVDALAERVGGLAPARSVVAACRLAAEVGSPLTAVLDQVAATLAAEAEARAEREASLAGPRATARVLLWLPAVGVLLGSALGADPVAQALDGGLGSAAVVGGVVLLVVGRRWTARMVGAARAAGGEG
ncbi:type II secretion system F family protein [Oerskovia flava]|uniref:type II secretion system F family protein n=1 Tax=Oerskovia flava TaxID=2986422 RepID=UPI002240D025|nr:type II secretion system F family protein [Oerskovia sp. JB1-3-2]